MPASENGESERRKQRRREGEVLRAGAAGAAAVGAAAAAQAADKETPPPRRESFNQREALKEPDFDIPISMVDVVFLLLIFFMTTAKFRTQERKMDIDLPTDLRPEHVDDDRPLNEDTVMIYLLYRSEKDRSGIYDWRGLKVRINEQNLGYDKPGLVRLYETLRQLAGSGKDKPVQVMATKNCPFLYVVSAIDSCKGVGFHKLRFTLPVRREGGGSDFWHRE